MYIELNSISKYCFGDEHCSLHKVSFINISCFLRKYSAELQRQGTRGLNIQLAAIAFTASVSTISSRMSWLVYRWLLLYGLTLFVFKGRYFIVLANTMLKSRLKGIINITLLNSPNYNNNTIIDRFIIDNRFSLLL